MSKSDDYLWDRSGSADPEVERLEKLLSPLAHDAPLNELRARRRSRWPWLVISAAVAAAGLLVWSRIPGTAPGPTSPLACGSEVRGFAFTAQRGHVTCGGASLPGGVLPVGEVLDTGMTEADLAIADIGTARLGSNTRVRLERTSVARHELYLEHGRMHARVTAPPRLFAVGTPSAYVTDLGCEYTLDIDTTGAGSIHVQTGLVELASDAGIVVAPAGTRTRLLAGRRASLPVTLDASPAILAAVSEYERGLDDGVARVLLVATPADAITIANLARLVPQARRAAVLERLMELAPAPENVTVQSALDDPAWLDIWFDEVVSAHTGNVLLGK